MQLVVVVTGFFLFYFLEETKKCVLQKQKSVRRAFSVSSRREHAGQSAVRVNLDLKQPLSVAGSADVMARCVSGAVADISSPPPSIYIHILYIDAYFPGKF